jgi:hypothetical protein
MTSPTWRTLQAHPCGARALHEPPHTDPTHQSPAYLPTYLRLIDTAASQQTTHPVPGLTAGSQQQSPHHPPSLTCSRNSATAGAVKERVRRGPAERLPPLPLRSILELMPPPGEPATPWPSTTKCSLNAHPLPALAGECCPGRQQRSASARSVGTRCPDAPARRTPRGARTQRPLLDAWQGLRGAAEPSFGAVRTAAW